MIGLVLATLVLGHSSAPLMQAAATATISGSIDTQGNAGRAERFLQTKLTAADTIDSITLSGGYALIGWSRDGKPAGQAILADTGTWTLVAMGQGAYDVPALVAYGLTNRQAHALLDQAVPLTPDLGYTPLLGNWQCASAAGSSVREAFAMDTTGRWLSFANSWTNGGINGSWQTYLYWDAATRHWTMAEIGSQGWAFSGKSNGWRDGTLTFEGTQSTPKDAFDARLTLQIAADGSMADTWEYRPNHAWAPYSSSHCVKLTP